MPDDKKIWPLHWIPPKNKRVSWFVYPGEKIVHGYNCRSTSVLKDLEFLGSKPKFAEEEYDSDSSDTSNANLKLGRRCYLFSWC